MIPVMIGVNEVSDLPMLLDLLFPPPSLIRSLRSIDHHHPPTRNYEGGIASQEFSFYEDIFFNSFHRVVPGSFLAEESDLHADLMRFANGARDLRGAFAVPNPMHWSSRMLPTHAHRGPLLNPFCRHPDQRSSLSYLFHWFLPCPPGANQWFQKNLFIRPLPFRFARPLSPENTLSALWDFLPRFFYFPLIYTCRIWCQDFCRRTPFLLTGNFYLCIFLDKIESGFFLLEPKFRQQV